MDPAPLSNASLPIQIHAYAALGAFVLGAVQLWGVKGTTQHRALGYAWVGLMLVVAITSFWIHDIRLWGLWSPIHLLSILVLGMLPLGLWYAMTCGDIVIAPKRTGPRKSGVRTDVCEALE